MKLITRRIPVAATDPADKPPKESLPDTALLYSVDDLAALARVNRVVVIRLCLAGVLPRWREIDGRRYWDHATATEAISTLARASSLAFTLRRRKSA